MTNLLHQLTALAWGLALVSGAMTWAAKVWLGRSLEALDHPAHFDRPAVYLGLVAPGLVSGVWLGSTLLHLGATGALGDVCCSVLAYSGSSWQHGLFGVGALLVVGLQLRSFRKRWGSSHAAHESTDRSDAGRRVRAICNSHPLLSEYAGRVRIVDCEGHVCATVGLLERRIEIAASLVERLDDSALESALLHEVAHLQLRDPFAGLVLSVAQSLNPFAPVLAREARAWRFAREVECDRRAVELGARPVSVADALVTAARATTGENEKVSCARLCGRREEALSARVRLLVHGALPERREQPADSLPTPGFALLALGGVLPHLGDGWILSVHCTIEELLHGFSLLM